MPYFPTQVEIPPYFCPNCKAWYRHSNMSCCVVHPPGSCCHEYEQRVEAPAIPVRF